MSHNPYQPPESDEPTGHPGWRGLALDLLDILVFLGAVVSLVVSVSAGRNGEAIAWTIAVISLGRILRDSFRRRMRAPG